MLTCGPFGPNCRVGKGGAGALAGAFADSAAELVSVGIKARLTGAATAPRKKLRRVNGFEEDFIGFILSRKIAFGAADDFRVVGFEMARIAQRGQVHLRSVAARFRQRLIQFARPEVAVLFVVSDEA